MCGIVGCIGVGPNKAAHTLRIGLKRLEYRGYDSAGMVVLSNGELQLRKSVGNIAQLEALLEGQPLEGTLGIAHTRWATHGEPSVINAHPHLSQNGKVAVVHNGTIENFRAIKQMLEEDGYTFVSGTDTEIVPMLIEDKLKKGANSLGAAVASALKEVYGAYAIAVVSADHPHELVAARQSSPLSLGLNSGALYIASDKDAFNGFASHAVELKDGEIVTMRDDGTYSFWGHDAMNEDRVEKLDGVALEEADKGIYEHLMYKEIRDQFYSLGMAVSGRVSKNGLVTLGGLRDVEKRLAESRSIKLVACGTSLYASMAGQLLIESIARIPTSAEHASEFQYRNPILNPQDAVIGISQSGETADTLGAIRLAKKQGVLLLGINNRVSSTLAREVDAGIYLHVGPEKAVASTKSFTGQVTVLAMLAVRLAQIRGVGDPSRLLSITSALRNLPELVEKTLEVEEQIKLIAHEYANARRVFCLGRGLNVPLAYEVALKLKEIAYLDAEGYPGGELKHGPLALVEEGVPVIAALCRDGLEEKMLSNMSEVCARKGDVIALVCGDVEVPPDKAKHVIRLPEVPPELFPIIGVIPMQLLAYHIGVMKGNNVDQPRNLAKSVTVE